MLFLFEHNPEAIRRRDNNGRPPLHTTVFSRSEVVRFLIEMYPEADSLVDNHGKLTIHLVCECEARQQIRQSLV